MPRPRASNGPSGSWPTCAGRRQALRRRPSPKHRGDSADDVAEIIFTSGATADPKGVVLTHRNILANIVPIEHEMAKYRKYARPFLPIRFLNLLPLSHMFGQAMATFVPPMLPGVVVFTRSYAPEDIVRQIRDRRISVLVCVPKMLEVLRDYVIRIAPEAAETAGRACTGLRRWWHYRRIHRMFGFKFWAMVVGAAPLDPELEAFWGTARLSRRPGLWAHGDRADRHAEPSAARLARGAVGKPISGVEIKIAEDGEILVRGENVTRGYFNAPEETREAFQDGWFHTGDIGELDANGPAAHPRTQEGNDRHAGRPQRLSGGRRARAQRAPGRQRVRGGRRAASAPSQRSACRRSSLPNPAPTSTRSCRQANAQLADHQKIRAAAVWPGAELPRTEGTRKLKRRELRTVACGSRNRTRRAGRRPVESHRRAGRPRQTRAVLERFAPGRDVAPATTIDELGLSSLERVELMMALEEAFQVTVDEAAFAAAKTVADLERADPAARSRGSRSAARGGRIDRRSRRGTGPRWRARVRRAQPADLDSSAGAASS